MNQIINLNHHAAAVLPYFIDSKGIFHFIFEQKDPNYKVPFFDNGLNFMGGNWQKGAFSDISPEETVQREVNQEFWNQYETPESLNELLGEKFLEAEPLVGTQYDDEAIQRIKIAGQMLMEDVHHSSHFIMQIHPPIMKSSLSYGLTVFVKSLSSEAHNSIESIIDEYNGKLTTDNLKWGSKIVSVSLEDINRQNTKFSWGYDQVLSTLLRESPVENDGVIRTLGFIDLREMDVPAEIERTKLGTPTYRGFESIGFQYLEK